MPVEFGSSSSSFHVVLQSIIYEWHTHTQCIPRGGRQQSVLYASVKLVPPLGCALRRHGGPPRAPEMYALCTHPTACCWQLKLISSLKSINVLESAFAF